MTESDQGYQEKLSGRAVNFFIKGKVNVEKLAEDLQSQFEGSEFEVKKNI